MGNGNAEENAQDRQAAFKSALTGKHLPVLTLDNKWYRLLNKTGSVQGIFRSAKRNGRCPESAVETTR